MMTASYRDVDISALDYREDIMVNKNTGAKNCYVSTQKGSNDPAHKLRFQLGTYDTEFLRAVYGVSTPFQQGPQQADNGRRSLELSLDGDEVLDFLNKLDENTLEKAHQVCLHSPAGDGARDPWGCAHCRCV